MTKEELEEKMSDKELIFCHEYIKDWNKSRAARMAGYSVHSARDIGCKLSTKPYIKEYIDLIKYDITNEAGISKLGLINELKTIAMSNFAEIIKKLKEAEYDFGVLTEDEQKCISEFSESVSGNRVKAYSKMEAIRDIFKAMGWNEPEKHDLLSSDESMSPKTVNIRYNDEDLDLGL